MFVHLPPLLVLCFRRRRAEKRRTGGSSPLAEPTPAWSTLPSGVWSKSIHLSSSLLMHKKNFDLILKSLSEKYVLPNSKIDTFFLLKNYIRTKQKSEKIN